MLVPGFLETRHRQGTNAPRQHRWMHVSFNKQAFVAGVLKHAKTIPVIINEYIDTPTCKGNHCSVSVDLSDIIAISTLDDTLALIVYPCTSLMKNRDLSNISKWCGFFSLFQDASNVKEHNGQPEHLRFITRLFHSFLLCKICCSVCQCLI